MMQNNHSEKSFSKKIRDKGYYIVLLLCLAAVGVSGYLFCKSLADESKSNLNEDSLAVRETVAQTKASQPADAAEENMVQAVIGTQEESTTEAKAVKPTAVSPVSGDVVQTYSVDHLSYNVTTRDWRTHEGVDLQAVSRRVEDLYILCLGQCCADGYIIPLLRFLFGSRPACLCLLLYDHRAGILRRLYLCISEQRCAECGGSHESRHTDQPCCIAVHLLFPPPLSV